MTTLTTLFYFNITTLKYHTTFTIPCFDTKILSDHAHYAVSVHYYNYGISNYAHYAVLTKVIKKYFSWLSSLHIFSPLLLNWEIILCSLHCLNSLLLNRNTALRLLRCLNTCHWKIISLKQMTEKQYLNYAHYPVLVHCY